MVSLDDIRVRSQVQVRTWDNKTVRGTVDTIEDDIKHNQPGITYHTVAGADHWAYLDQIVKVIKK